MQWWVGEGDRIGFVEMLMGFLAVEVLNVFLLVCCWTGWSVVLEGVAVYSVTAADTVSVSVLPLGEAVRVR